MDGNWTAFHDHVPPGPPTLRVNGDVNCPSPNSNVVLTRAVPQGANLRDLLLDLTFEPPEDPDAAVITPCSASFEEVTELEYDTVTIRGEGGGTVEVKELEK